MCLNKTVDSINNNMWIVVQEGCQDRVERRLESDLLSTTNDCSLQTEINQGSLLFCASQVSRPVNGRATLNIACHDQQAA
jgi:hypothetical protein